MEITINIWNVLWVVICLGIGLMMLSKKFRHWLIGLSMVSVVLFPIYVVGASAYSLNSIHQYVPYPYINYISFEERLLLKEVPPDVLKKRYEEDKQKRLEIEAKFKD